MTERVRSGLLVRGLLEVLNDAEQPLPAGEVAPLVIERIGGLTSYEQTTLPSGEIRWKNFFGFHSADMATVGWMTKTGG